ncbi:MAG TPA: hypothetical protein VH208_04265, partial [Myxococcaceae bacterium]|nr:hypothetical protein [Myxococcaceae bacterium]
MSRGLLIAACFLTAASAGARTVVSVLPIDGPNGPAARKALFGALRGQRGLEVLPLGRPARRAPPADLEVEGTVVRMTHRISVRILSAKTGDVLDGLF